ncbi:MAG: hypothetical protein V4582_10255 [Pseudomonadota bacterium]
MDRDHTQGRARQRALIWTAAVAVLGASIVACSGGGGSTPTPTPTPSPVPSPTPSPSPSPPPVNGQAWQSYGGDAQHSAQTGIATQSLGRIVWRTPVDLAPPYTTQGYLLVHYGSPAITAKNTVIVPVKTGAQAGFRFEAHSASGALAWSVNSDYILPAHNWTPSFNVTLTPGNRIYAPGAGGKVLYRDDADAAGASTQTAVFYGASVYAAASAAYDAAVTINTPITSDAQGNIYFGFIAKAGNGAGLASGIARIGADGVGSWAGAATLSADAQISKVAMNSAPAISKDQNTVYVAVNTEAPSGTRPRGYLLALDSKTLAVKGKAALLDPRLNAPAGVSDDSTAAPSVGPDGDVYFGVLEAPSGSHNGRGWLLHFDATLAQLKIPGSFGWDDTAAIVPASMVPSYSGSSPYLVMTKYNNYQRAGGGDGQNKVAVLDPGTAQADSISQLSVMKEVLTILGPTPDPANPGGVTEWCINIAAIDPFTKSILVNSEDGYLYRWSMASNTLSEKIQLTSGLGESYTPVAVGPDGVVYAINNAVLFAVGK